MAVFMFTFVARREIVMGDPPIRGNSHWGMGLAMFVFTFVAWSETIMGVPP